MKNYHDSQTSTWDLKSIPPKYQAILTITLLQWHLRYPHVKNTYLM
jgi:hypothetical protein